MATVPLQGSSAQTSFHTDDPRKERFTEDSFEDIPMSDLDVRKEPFVEDTFINKTSLNPERYPDRVDTLRRYADGSHVKVTYFHNTANVESLVTSYTDWSTVEHTVHNLS